MIFDPQQKESLQHNFCKTGSKTVVHSLKYGYLVVESSSTHLLLSIMKTSFRNWYIFHIHFRKFTVQ